MSGYLEKCEEEIMNLVLEFTGKVEKEQLKYKDLVQLYRTRISLALSSKRMENSG